MGNLMIQDIPDSERPRERLQRLGAEALSDIELLAIILRTGTHGNSAMALANGLLQRAGGSLKRLSGQSVAELTTCHGMGPTKAVTLAASFELARRMLQILPVQPVLNNAASVVNYCRSQLTDESREELHIITLDVQLRIMGDKIVSTGLINKTLSHAREIFRPAIRAACSKILLWHNHPSGDCRPSAEDDEVTRQTLIAGKLLDIELLDHIVIGRPGVIARYSDGYFSYKETGRFLDILKDTGKRGGG